MVLGWATFKVVQRIYIPCPILVTLEPKGKKNFKKSSCQKLLVRFQNNLVQIVLGDPLPKLPGVLPVVSKMNVNIEKTLKIWL